MLGAVKSSCRKNERRGWESEEQGEIGWPLNGSLFAEEKNLFFQSEDLFFLVQPFIQRIERRGKQRGQVRIWDLQKP
ncbi:hypothetical protein DS67_05835 [Mesotoga sp. SC_4PWA21]|nr:hypothetical protein DS67_05835 [Mesotoga sp. SC_4PWA21]